MKSTVLITAISSDSRYTAASSEVLKPTSRLGSLGGLSALSASARSDGPILAAQPHVRESPVRVFPRKNCIFLNYELFKPVCLSNRLSQIVHRQ